MRTRGLLLAPMLSLATLVAAAPASADERATLEVAVGPTYGIQTGYDEPYGYGASARVGARWGHLVVDAAFTYFLGSDRSGTGGGPDDWQTSQRRYFGVIDVGYQGHLGEWETRAFVGLGHLWQRDVGTASSDGTTFTGTYTYDWWMLTPGVSIAYPIDRLRVGLEGRAILPFWPLFGTDRESRPDPLPTISMSLFVGGAFQL